jgi:SIR2-like domain
MMLDRILDTVESCNLNFLIGSGLSSPYLRTLGLIETLLTELERKELPEEGKRVIRCSLYKSYFDGVISKNSKLLENDPEAKPVLDGYFDFIKTISTILLKRKSTILGKEINLFTTNIDICLEQTIERIGLECNDGFSGRFAPWFALSNFKKAHFKRSLQYDNVSELPTVNLLKLHGSLTWRIAGTQGDDRIFFSPDLSHVRTIQTKNITPALLLEVGEGSTLESLIAGCGEKRADGTIDDFIGAFDSLPIVNPTKAKFKQTILNQTHYELLRIYSNELEKENTLLLVGGFSFADEHIREITLQAANSNPTLIIYVIAYNSSSAAEIRGRFPTQNVRNDKIVIVGPDVDKKGRDMFKFDLPTINKMVLGKILERIGAEDVRPTANSRPA